MTQIVRLCDIAPGESAVVRELQNEGRIRRRLCDLGLVEGARVECVGKSPSGDPIAYLICGAVIAIRRMDSNLVLVVRTTQEDHVWD